MSCKTYHWVRTAPCTVRGGDTLNQLFALQVTKHVSS